MLRSVRRALALSVLLALSGCAKSSETATGGSGGGGATGGSSGSKAEAGAPTGGAGGASGMDAMGPPMSCRDIRVCLFNCGTDMTCAKACVSSAPAKARQQYEEAQTCSMNACPMQEDDCRCQQECLAGGQCSDLVDACDDAISDPWCDVRCH